MAYCTVFFHIFGRLFWYHLMTLLSCSFSYLDLVKHCFIFSPELGMLKIYGLYIVDTLVRNNMQCWYLMW